MRGNVIYKLIADSVAPNDETIFLLILSDASREMSGYYAIHLAYFETLSKRHTVNFIV